MNYIYIQFSIQENKFKDICSLNIKHLFIEICHRMPDNLKLKFLQFNLRYF